MILWGKCLKSYKAKQVLFPLMLLRGNREKKRFWLLCARKPGKSEKAFSGKLNIHESEYSGQLCLRLLARHAETLLYQNAVFLFVIVIENWEGRFRKAPFKSPVKVFKWCKVVPCSGWVLQSVKLSDMTNASKLGWELSSCKESERKNCPKRTG